MRKGFFGSILFQDLNKLNYMHINYKTLHVNMHKVLYESDLQMVPKT